MLTELGEVLLYCAGAVLPYTLLFFAMAERPRRKR